MIKEKIPTRLYLSQLFSAAMFWLLLSDTALPQKALAQEITLPPTPVSQPYAENHVGTESNLDMFRGTPVDQVPELQLNYTEILHARFGEINQYCTTSFVEDPMTPGSTRFYLTAEHCGDGDNNSRFNTGSITVAGIKTVKFLKIPGSTESILGVLEHSISLEGRSAVRVAKTELTASDQVIVVGHGQSEHNSPNKIANYGVFEINLDSCYGAPHFDIIAESHEPQITYGDSGSTAVKAKPIIIPNPAGEPTLIYEAVATARALCGNMSPFYDPERKYENVPAVFSPITSQASRDFINGTIEALSNAEISPVPETYTHILLNGKPIGWDTSTSEYISHDESREDQITINQVYDSNNDSEIFVESISQRVVNESPYATTGFQILENQTHVKLDSGQNTFTLNEVSFTPSEMNTLKNSLYSDEIIIQFIKRMPDGSEISQQAIIRRNMNINNPAIVDMKSNLDDQHVIYEHRDNTLSIQKNEKYIEYNYTGRERPLSAQVILKFDEHEFRVNPTFTWTQEERSTGAILTKTASIEIPLELRLLIGQITRLPIIKNRDKGKTYLPIIGTDRDDFLIPNYP